MVKGKRWKKGQSSSSNPEIRKYRDAAKSTFFNFISGNSKILFLILKMKNKISEKKIKFRKEYIDERCISKVGFKISYI